MLTVGILGEVEVRRDGVRLDVPAGKTTELLARLALDPGVRVRVDALLEDLWGAPTGRNTLQSKVSQLRHALGDRDLVVGSPEGYTLDLPADCVDALRVMELAGESSAARSSGDAALSLEHARAGLELFRGDVLVEAGDWAAAHRTRLEEVRLGLLEDAMAARVDLGAGGEVVAELESLVAQHPLREGLWGSLITALYRAGRQADALAAYARVRRVLVDELGIEPGTALRELEAQVLAQSTSLAGQPRRLAVPGNLPPPTTALVGRDEDAVALAAAVEEHRLITLVGPAGVGKTRLALEVGRRLAAGGGTWLVRLDAVDAGARLAQVVAETLHVVGGDQALHERLSGAGTVLLLDNCEHVVAQVAELTGTLLEAVPTLHILATSQVPLGTDEERVQPLAPLTQEQSVDLFTQRARELRRQFVLDEQTTLVVEQVCRSLDGLPLAIELAAARVRSLSVREISRRLDDRFALLRDPTSQRPERRRALEGAIAWSYDLLFPDDQAGLMALATFAGSASLTATEHVLAALDVPAGAVLDTIGRLVDRSLVSLDEAEDGELRYRLLDSIRAYAAERLVDSGQVEACSAAHARWYADRAVWCDAHVRSSDQPECLAIARAERAEIDLALSWCAAHDPALGLRIACGFGWTWVVLGDGTAGAARVRAAQNDGADDGADDRDRATALLLAGWLEASAGDVVLAQTDLDQAREVAAALDDPVLLADVDRHQAFLAIQQGRPDLVLASATASLSTYRARELSWQAAGSLLLAAYGSLMLGDTSSATRNATEAVGIVRPLGDSWGMVHAEAMLGGIAQAEGRFGEAARALEQAADQSVVMGFLGQAALHRATLARVQQRLGDDAAQASYERAISDALAVGDGRLAATARLNLARATRIPEEGPLGPVSKGSRALDLLEENERWYDSAGGGDFALLNTCVLAALRDDEGTLRQVLDQARAEQNPEVEVLALDALSRLTSALDPEKAASLLATADALAPSVAHLVSEADRVDAAVARAALSHSCLPTRQQENPPP